jgi:digeranylgeranylglycerophospholipid reductase
LNCDVTVVGAGPAGLTIARICSEAGYSVVICEEHATVGLPKHCTGKISTNALHDLGIKPETILTEITGAKFISPNLNSFSIKRPNAQAVIVDRVIFDQHLSDIAVNAGATLLTNTKAIDIQVGPSVVKVKTRGKREALSIQSRIVIGADGAPSTVARASNLSMKHSAMRLGAQREIEDIAINPEMVEVFLGKTWAPGFFAWLVPTSTSSARIGLALPLHSAPDTITYLDHFMKNHPLIRTRLKTGRCTHQGIHLLPTGGPPDHTTSDGILLVGDAAGQVKSTTGGGIYFGISCANIAGEVIIEALSNTKELVKKTFLQSYEERWRVQVGHEIKFTVHMRRFLDSLTDDEINYLFKIATQNPELIQRIEATGEIDRQSKVSLSSLRSITTIVKRPRLLYKLSRLMTQVAFK